MTGDDDGVADAVAASGALFESFPDPLLGYVAPTEATGPPRVVTGVNAAFRAAFDVEADAVVGAGLEAVTVPGRVTTGRDGAHGPAAEDADASEDGGDGAPVTTAAAILENLSGDPGRDGWLRTDANGQPRYYRVRSFGVDPDGERCLYFADVTASERPRRELAASVDRLERLASVARHDIRNPLEVAKIRLEAAAESGEAVHFEKAAAALDRIEGIARDVLVGGGTDASEDVPLDRVAATAWETVDTGAATLDVDEGLPVVRGDPDRLTQLFENLFRNAVEHGSASPPRAGDAGERGSRDVTVTVTSIPGGFAVADDGPGLQEGAGERVFEAGYTTVPENTGLGLSIVRQIAREHGWRVTASNRDESVRGAGGARFAFTDLE